MCKPGKSVSQRQQRGAGQLWLALTSYAAQTLMHGTAAHCLIREEAIEVQLTGQYSRADGALCGWSAWAHPHAWP